MAIFIFIFILKAGNFISLFSKKSIVNVAGPFSFPVRVIHKVSQIRAGSFGIIGHQIRN